MGAQWRALTEQAGFDLGGSGPAGVLLNPTSSQIIDLTGHPGIIGIGVNGDPSQTSPLADFNNNSTDTSGGVVSIRGIGIADPDASGQLVLAKNVVNDESSYNQMFRNALAPTGSGIFVQANDDGSSALSFILGPFQPSLEIAIDVSGNITLTQNGPAQSSIALDHEGDIVITAGSPDGSITLTDGAGGVIEADGTGNVGLVAVGTGMVASLRGDQVAIQLNDAGSLGFFAGGPVTKQIVTGAKLPSDVVMASLLTALAAYGLITDSTT